MFETSYLVGGIAVAVLMTYATRIIPFLFFAKREPSNLIRYIEWNMPVMIMVILVFYALKDVVWVAYPYGLAELIGIAITIATYLRYKNALLSIISATVVYMLLVQKVF